MRRMRTAGGHYFHPRSVLMSRKPSIYLALYYKAIGSVTFGVFSSIHSIKFLSSTSPFPNEEAAWHDAFAMKISERDVNLPMQRNSQ